MMTCKRIRKKLSAFLDGEVSSAEGSWIEQHLAICTECGSEARALTATYQLLERCPQPLRAEWGAQFGTADGRKGALGAWRLALGKGGGMPRVQAARLSVCRSQAPSAKRQAPERGRTLSLLPIVTGLLVGAILGSWVWPRMSPPVSPPPVAGDSRSSRPRDPDGFGGLARDPLEDVYVTLTSSRNR
jgi:anti-sigma factor RsiW